MVTRVELANKLADAAAAVSNVETASIAVSESGADSLRVQYQVRLDNGAPFVRAATLTCTDVVVKSMAELTERLNSF
jgi:hypothetical protein